MDFARCKNGGLNASKGARYLFFAEIDFMCFVKIPSSLGRGQSIGIYFARPTIKSLGPSNLIREMSANPAFFIQPEYSVSL